MTAFSLVRRNLTHFWRTNLAVLAGVAVAVSVLAGALLVGASVRDSLRDLALQRLGRIDHVITSGLFFREALAESLRASGTLVGVTETAVPLIAIRIDPVWIGTRRAISKPVLVVESPFCGVVISTGLAGFVFRHPATTNVNAIVASRRVEWRRA